MRSEKEVRKVRDVLWEAANIAMDEGNNAVGIIMTEIAQALDWVLGEDEWYIGNMVEAAKEKIKGD